jgi:non-ribosomal peptide synthetase component F
LNAGGRTPSDFPGARLDQRSLDLFWKRYPGLEDVSRLTPMQRLFFVMEESQSAVGFEQWQFRIEGRIDPARLRQAFAGVVARHTILRSAFSASEAGEPLQIVLPGLDLPWSEQDWRDLSAPEQKQHLSDLLTGEQAKGFDLERPPLIRVTLARLADDRFELVWSTHHLCIDGWSWPIFFQEVSAIYVSLDAGTVASLPPAPSYSQYVAWLDKAANAESFWQDQLSGLTAPTPIALEKGVQRPRAKHAMLPELVTSLTGEQTARLQSMARTNKITLSTMVQGAWAILLAHYNASEDVVFGSAFSGRPAELPGVETMIGPCVTNVPVRISIKPDQPLPAWLPQLQQQQFDLAQHQYIGLDVIQGLTKIPLRYRLFDSLVVFQNYQVAEAARAIGSARLIPILAPQHTNYPLTLIISPGEKLGIRLIHEPSRLSPAVAETYAAHLKAVLETMVEQPALSLAEVMAYLPDSMRGKAAAVAAEAAQHRRSAVALSAPTSDSERMIATIWQELLGVEHISLDENFFDIGGHSLLLLHAHRRLRSALRTDVPVVALLTYPTVRALARYLDGNATSTNERAAAIERAKKQREALTRKRTVARSA